MKGTICARGSFVVLFGLEWPIAMADGFRIAEVYAQRQRTNGGIIVPQEQC